MFTNNKLYKVAITNTNRYYYVVAPTPDQAIINVESCEIRRYPGDTNHGHTIKLIDNNIVNPQTVLEVISK